MAVKNAPMAQRLVTAVVFLVTKVIRSAPIRPSPVTPTAVGATKAPRVFLPAVPPSELSATGPFHSPMARAPLETVLRIHAIRVTI